MSDGRRETVEGDSLTRKLEALVAQQWVITAEMLSSLLNETTGRADSFFYAQYKLSKQVKERNDVYSL